MKKIFLPLALLLTLAACKKDEVQDKTLEALIKTKDVKGLQAYKDRQKAKLDSLNNVMAEVDKNLTAWGVSQTTGYVSVLKLQETSFAHNVEIQGNVTTDQDVTIQPDFSGVLSLYVKEGQRVNRGQVIGRIADGGLNDQYKQAQIQVSSMNAQLQIAKTDANLKRIAYEKQAALWKQKIGSEFQYLQAKAAYDAAQRQVAASQSTVSATQKAADAVKSNLAKTAIVAPFSGVIDKVITQNGQVVAPGRDIVKLISLGIMRVEAKVPETYLANIKPGTNVEVVFPALNKSIKSSVRLVGNYIDPATRTFIIQIPVPNEGGYVKPNLLAQIKIQDYLNPSAIQIPSQYIYDDAAHKSYVFVATNINGENGVAKKVLVETGQKSENSVEITRGLKAGDIVITDGSKNLTEGQKVKISK
ncbi:efflux RND transporter periplasmic adaptor subunit [Chryseobacterium daecheongense]|uniref:Efflux RND transporter periplasmic adaptor subunit n=1 Tax=Chryseobacterium daecheongense TaxID=192389 RepID=A0A3N0W4H8_9FLAO|nr:efflux RND transporter periplasmic adaptor subunit [Chryseobacterium daecheongense]ROH99973.1 efflux RND transporter periplasmic adaptor subunit [Chryseobacterium daecheongense]TDX95091.1 RND family efflux transporter MFP subunit [Chryseobacterium daecheongense]